MEIVTLLSKWKREDEIQSLSPDAKVEYLTFRQQHNDEWKKESHKFYRWSNVYQIEHGVLASGEAVKRLLRKEEKKSTKKGSPSAPRLVIPMLEVFDVIKATHSDLGHLGMERTYNEISKTHYSITQAMVNIYVKRCYDEDDAGMADIGFDDEILGDGNGDLLEAAQEIVNEVLQEEDGKPGIRISYQALRS